MEQQIIFLAALIFGLIIGISLLAVVVALWDCMVNEIRWRAMKSINYKMLIDYQIRENYERLEDSDKKADEIFK